MEIDPGLFQENERTAPSADNRRYAQIGPLDCEAGGRLEEVTIAYETWGKLNAARDNAIVVCHALTGDSHAIGWWSNLIGPGKAIDTDRYFVIGTNSLGGCQGTTGPASPHPDDGRPYASRFPIITLRDMIEVQIRLIDTLGIDCLRAVAGGSMGGMQALQWTVQAPGRVRKAFVTASCAAHSAMQIGFNEAARQAIIRDPKWRGGDYPPDDGPDAGLSVSRMIGHLSFLSEQAFAAKFGRRLQGKDRPDYRLGVEFEVESYLNYQGDKFTRRFDANSFLILTRAIDYLELTSLSASESEYLFVSFSTDWLYPSHQSRHLLQMARDAGCPARHVEIDLPYGHDAFLLDGVQQGAHLNDFLSN
ncbi:homoserine O-acetyltransferase MetX [Fimbriimonas ginsengisoli]|uniref:Homoserine O-acetyltransferase n=1 Tax=Fimbriimonas ginsengisoli Gsoil 348 TaxID=661478 RepID=A0A068NIX2_FIMGI|nr:homoserine O-acetyltransferase [Fimbriimonas ginsengisoli]AIE83417.1 homoserine O-acetyltransferase MetX2 [Fimbriimonas ginsengisoli Gsoil 348]